MKFCTHCGNELMDEAVICPKCGCQAENYNVNNRNGSQSSSGESLSTLAIIGFVFAFVQSIVGLICSIIAYKNAVAEGNEKSKSFAKCGIIISAVFIGLAVLFVILYIVLICALIANGYYPNYTY